MARQNVFLELGFPKHEAAVMLMRCVFCLGMCLKMPFVIHPQAGKLRLALLLKAMLFIWR